MEKYFNYILFGIFILIFPLILLKPIELLNDSAGYIEMSLIRSPSYPIFVNVVHKIFGDFYLMAIVCIQFAFLSFAVYFLIRTLRKVLSLNPFWFFLLTFLLFSPALYEVNVCSRILSEGIAYPLYIIVFALFIEGFSETRTKPLMLSLPVLLILLLTRGQFVYLAIVGFLLALYILWKQKNIIGRSWILVLFILIPIIANLTDRTYHYVFHHHFVATPWTGIHLITPAFFVADESDASIFSSEEEKSFFLKIYGDLEEKKLTLSSIEKENTETTFFYIQNFTKIANETVFDEGRYFFGTPIENAETFIKLDKLTTKMAPSLIRKNFMKWSKLNLQNFFFGMSGAKYVLLYLILLGTSFFLLFKIPSPEIKFIFLGALLTLFNVGIVAIGMHTIKRFTFYNDWILFFIFFILIDFLIKKQKQYATRS